jgi:NADP-reducing hydrogenase subunit HndC
MEQAPRPPYDKIIYICINERPAGEDSCGGRASADIAKKIKESVKSMNLPVKIRVSRTQCLGLCEIGPNVAIFPDNVWYHRVRLEDVPEILRKHVPAVKA